MSGPFAAAAMDYAERGLSVIPVGGQDGKTPLVHGWQKVGRRAAGEFIKRFPDANIGILDGPITRVDVDDPGLIDDAVETFGDSPIWVATPRGGVHLWYRGAGEKRTLRVGGKRIDLLGIGGFGVAPPSRIEGVGAYAFMRGTLDDLDGLPTLKREAPVLPTGQIVRGVEPASDCSHGKPWPQMVKGSGRNPALFRAALREAKLSDNLHHLCLRLEILNETFGEPLPDREVRKIAGSAWGYETRGENWVGSQARFVVTSTEIAGFEECPDALLLWCHLVHAHGWRNGGTFKLSNALAALLNWSPYRLRVARDFLCKTGKLVIVVPGMKGRRHVTLARLVIS